MIEQLQKENHSLKSQLESLNGQYNIILDHLPILFFHCDTNQIFELYQGKGIEQRLMLHDPTLLYNLINQIPMVLNSPKPTVDSFSDTITVGDYGRFALSYELIKTEAGKIEGLVGYLIDQTNALNLDTAAQKKNPETILKAKKMERIRKTVHNQFNESLVESFAQRLESQILIHMSKLVLAEQKS